MDRESDSDIVDAAIAWQQATACDGADVDWDGFTRWLEADVRHRRVYDELAAIDAAIDDHRAEIGGMLRAADVQQATIATPADRRAVPVARRWFLGTGIAAALALAIGVPVLQSHDGTPTAYTTAPGATRRLGLNDGSRIELSAQSTIDVGRRQRSLALLHGAAYFDVPHDPGRTLVVTAGGYRITDIGTRFAVDVAGDNVTVAVAEGRVTVTSAAGVQTPLSGGQRFSSDAGGGTAITRVAPDTVGSWRNGRLMYDNVSLAEVASDIGRYTGTRIDLAAPLGARRFSGVLVIGDGAHLVSDLAAVAGLGVERDGARIMLSPARG